jgi:hypothetical protein
MEKGMNEDTFRVIINVIFMSAMYFLGMWIGSSFDNVRGFDHRLEPYHYVVDYQTKDTTFYYILDF